MTPDKDHTTPAFVQLFPIEENAESWQLTPRTAAAMWQAACLLADFAYDDVDEYGDAPVVNGGDRAVFLQYPRITWGQNAAWRRRAARSFDDLADDLAKGLKPEPRCPAEEMALHLILQHAEAAVTDGWARVDELAADAPKHPNDFEWHTAVEVLFQDTDILTLFENSLDGVEDPGDETNQLTGMGDYRPCEWFEPFSHIETRDWRRGFRR